MQEHNLISQECERLREENMRLLYHSKSTINLKEHEEQIRNLSNNNKQLSGMYESTVQGGSTKMWHLM